MPRADARKLMWRALDNQGRSCLSQWLLVSREDQLADSHALLEYWHERLEQVMLLDRHVVESSCVAMVAGQFREMPRVDVRKDLNHMLDHQGRATLLQWLLVFREGQLTDAHAMMVSAYERLEPTTRLEKHATESALGIMKAAKLREMHRGNVRKLMYHMLDDQGCASLPQWRWTLREDQLANSHAMVPHWHERLEQIMMLDKHVADPSFVAMVAVQPRERHRVDVRKVLRHMLGNQWRAGLRQWLLGFLGDQPADTHAMMVSACGRLEQATLAGSPRWSPPSASWRRSCSERCVARTCRSSWATCLTARDAPTCTSSRIPMT